jgi:predicted metalloprotease
MRWTPGSGRSGDVVDRRGSVRRRRRVAGGGGIGVVAVIVYLLITLIGGGGGGSGPAFDIPSSGSFNDGVQAGTGSAQALPASQDPDKNLREFSEFVVTDVQDAWAQIFADAGQQFRRSQLVLYTGGVDTGCGSATSAVGPFYCPADEKVYIDLSFYAAMRDQLGAPGDFAWAYVIAHELGHHVQTLTGTTQQVTAKQQSDPSQANALSVRFELQADCYAGVWGQTAFKQGQLEDGDLEEGLAAAASVGDDRIQAGTGSIDPDSFTHGTSEQRVRWFRVGFDSGEPGSCDTFSAESV